jgi:preprotein translocase subunit SecA
MADEEARLQLQNTFGGIYFAPGVTLSGKTAAELSDEIYALAVKTYEAKEAAYSPATMRELERVVMLRVVDEYWMENIDAMDDLKQGISLRSYAQHDPVVEYKNEGYEMFQAMVQAIREETVRRLFLVRLQPTQEVKRQRVAKETGTGAAVNSQVKKQPVRKERKAGPNDPCPCGSGLKYKKCCMQKDKGM